MNFLEDDIDLWKQIINIELYDSDIEDILEDKEEIVEEKIVPEKWEKGDKGDKWDKWEDGKEWKKWKDWKKWERWPKWDKGDNGEKGDKGDKWDDWKDLKFTDLTPYQIQTLTGAPWNPWEWVPRWGTTWQVLKKASDRNYHTEWTTDSDAQNLQSVTDIGNTTTNSIEAQSFVTTWGTSADFVKWDWTLDRTAYTPLNDTWTFLKLDQTTPQTITNTTMIGSSVLIMDGSSGFSWTVGTYEATVAGTTYAAYFYDWANSTTLWDGTYAINTNGNSLFNGDIEITDTTKWYILKDELGTRYRLQVTSADGGTLILTAL